MSLFEWGIIIMFKADLESLKVSLGGGLVKQGSEPAIVFEWGIIIADLESLNTSSIIELGQQLSDLEDVFVLRGVSKTSIEGGHQ